MPAFWQWIVLLATILVSGTFVSSVFQYLKQWVPANNTLRVFLVWLFSLVVAIAEAVIAGQFDSQVVLLASGGTVDPVEVFALGQTIFASATAIYNYWWKDRKE